MNIREGLRATDRTLAIWLGALTAVLTISGYATYFVQTHAVWSQWTFLLHSGLGIFATLILVTYLGFHFRRTIGYRRPVMALFGVATGLVFLALAISGLQILVEGQSNAWRWVYDVHIWTAAATLGLMALHLLFHRLLSLERRQRTDQSGFSSLLGSMSKAAGLATLGGMLIVATATLAYGLKPSPFRDEPAVWPYQYPYGEHPFRPSQTETATEGFLDARRIGGSERCAACHTEIARQWQASIHSQAAADQAYQTNINLLAEKKGIPATRYCEGCHAPVALISGQLTEGGRLDTQGHMQEGVSCMSCHGIDRVEHTQGVASYRFSPPEPYLFEGEEGGWPTRIHNFVLRLQPRQHRADMARPVLATPEICATCHAQFMDEDFNHWGWVKMQDDYLSWLNGPYSGQTRQPFAQTNVRRCQDCHFPLAPGQDPAASSQGMIKTHFNIGANSAIPSYTGNRDQLLRTVRFLAADKIRIVIDRPNRPAATETARHIDPRATRTDESPAYAYLGEEVTVRIAVTNAEVGHAFPGGTTDINEAWLYLAAIDGQGRKIHESGVLDAQGDVDADAYFYKSIPIDRQGDEVWRHDLFNMVGDSFKRVIPPGGTDVTIFSFKIPDWAKGPVTVIADLKYRKLNNRYARWALKDGQIQLPIVTMATSSLRLPLRLQPEVALSE